MVSDPTHVFVGGSLGHDLVLVGIVIDLAGMSANHSMSIVKAATRTVLQRSSTAETMVSSDFSFSIWTFQRPSKFGHVLNNHNRKDSTGDQAEVGGAISPAQCRKQRPELFFKGVRRRR
jgi:hypothetical protein